LDTAGAINADALVAAGLIRRSLDGVRLLAKGEVKSKLKLVVAGASAAAVAAVEKAGGSVEITAPKKAEAQA
jgi:large subunit ribosomal protein L15